MAKARRMSKLVMKKGEIHFRESPHTLWEAVCGVDYPPRITTKRSRVTCRNCQRTKVFRKV